DEVYFPKITNPICFTRYFFYHAVWRNSTIQALLGSFGYFVRPFVSLVYLSPPHLRVRKTQNNCSDGNYQQEFFAIFVFTFHRVILSQYKKHYLKMINTWLTTIEEVLTA